MEEYKALIPLKKFFFDEIVGVAREFKIFDTCYRVEINYWDSEVLPLKPTFMVSRWNFDPLDKYETRPEKIIQGDEVFWLVSSHVCTKEPTLEDVGEYTISQKLYSNNGQPLENLC